MNAQELAAKFASKVTGAAAIKKRDIAKDTLNANDRDRQIELCKDAFEQTVLPFLTELKSCFVDNQFSFAPQIDIRDHRPIGVSFSIGDGSTTNISVIVGHVVITRAGDSGSFKGVPFVYAWDSEPHILLPADLTREKISRLVEMAMDNDPI